ncbi:hypothetical protein [Demequina sp. NBRC 110056]|uniref:hypothetical protein n=1 Tax=Demequina sp. NBRC 110056 TaxID=1570345 RepID=UPI0009FF9421|nr:hypothetical protein [Demequina sp. NBRC 110056]
MDTVQLGIAGIIPTRRLARSGLNTPESHSTDRPWRLAPCTEDALRALVPTARTAGAEADVATAVRIGAPDMRQAPRRATRHRSRLGASPPVPPLS